MAVLRIAKLVSAHGEQLCRLTNISSGGAMAVTAFAYLAGEPVRLELKSGWSASARIAWARGSAVGLTFDDPVDPLAALAGDVAGDVAQRSPRVNVAVDAHLRIGSHYRVARTSDISLGGIKVALADPGWVGEDVVVSISGLPLTTGSLRWQAGGQAGIAFHRPLELDLLASWLAGQR